MSASMTARAIVVAALFAAPAFGQATQGATGTTSGPAADTPATMNNGATTGMTASPHQKKVLRKKKSHTPAQPDSGQQNTGDAQPHR